jgi:5-methylcytosine-specific restriction endonuclease McrA
MPTGHYTRIKTGERITIVCETCGKEFELLKSVYRHRIKTTKPRYCSLKCRGIGMRKEGTHVETTCTQCGKLFTKRSDHITDNNFCSKTCQHEFRRIDGAKWRDGEYIKNWMARYHQDNKERAKELGTRWNVNNKKKVLEIKKKYRINNREKIRLINQNRRAAKNEGSLTLEEWESVLSMHDYRCANCGTDENITMDHIIPIVNGGSYSVNNVQPLCKSCNSRKATKTIDYRRIDARIVK